MHCNIIFQNLVLSEPVFHKMMIQASFKSWVK